MRHSLVNPPKDLDIIGAADQWKLISKAVSQSQGFMRSTKAMVVPGGCLVQISTMQKSHANYALAEALQFVPGLTLERADKDTFRFVALTEPENANEQDQTKAATEPENANEQDQTKAATAPAKKTGKSTAN